MAQNTGNITVRISSDTQKKLDDVAVSVDRSRNWVINEAIENYLSVYEWLEKRIRDRLNSAKNGGVFLNSDQVDKIVESFKP